MFQAEYDWPGDIPDEVIIEQFNNANEVQFSAKPFNSIQHRSIGIGGLGWWLPLTRVLPLVGITPQDLRPVFNPQRKSVKRQIPFNWSWFGLNPKRYQMVDIQLPEKIDTYDQLGSFLLNKQNFLKLAVVFDKAIKVFSEDGRGDHHYLFTVHPTGEIVEAR